MPAVPGRATERGEQLVRLEDRSRRRARSANVPEREHRASPSVRRRTSTPPSRSESSTCSPANGSSRSISRSPRWTSVTCEPSAAARLRHLDADDAAAEDREPCAAPCFAVVASMFVHGFASRRPGMSGISAPSRSRRRRPVRATQRLRPSTTTRRSPSRRAAAAHERDAVLLEPRQLAGSRRGRGSPRRAARARRRRRSGRRSRPGDALAPRARARPGAAAPSTACRRSTSTRRRRAPARRSRPRGRSARAALPSTSPAAPAPSTTTSNSRMRLLASIERVAESIPARS